MAALLRSLEGPVERCAESFGQQHANTMPLAPHRLSRPVLLQEIYYEGQYHPLSLAGIQVRVRLTQQRAELPARGQT